jgi:hypothetical protein
MQKRMKDFTESLSAFPVVPDASASAVSSRANKRWRGDEDVL